MNTEKQEPRYTLSEIKLAVRKELSEANKALHISDGFTDEDYKYLGVIDAASKRLPEKTEPIKDEEALKDLISAARLIINDTYPYDVDELIKNYKHESQQNNSEGWIDVNDRLPPVGTGGVLVVVSFPNETFQMVANFDEDGWIAPPFFNSYKNISHWKPLPKLPNQ